MPILEMMWFAQHGIPWHGGFWTGLGWDGEMVPRAAGIMATNAAAGFPLLSVTMIYDTSGGKAEVWERLGILVGVMICG